MKKKFIIISVLFLILYVVISSMVGRDTLSVIKNGFSTELKYKVKKYLIPYKFIDGLEKENKVLEKDYFQSRNLISKLAIDHDVKLKKSLDTMIFKKIKNEKLLNYQDLKLKVFENKKPFLMGVNNLTPGSAFIEYYDDNLFIVSSTGILGYGKLNSEQIIFTQIKNNIEKFIGINQFQKGEETIKGKKKKVNWFSIKDLKISNNKVYVSYTREMEEDCWNTSVIFSDLNLSKLNFQNLFSPNTCIHSVKNKDNEFVAHQSGGRIVSIDNNYILLSVGDYRSRYLSQDKESVFGKILKINVNTKKFETISIGHRNAQGLFYDKKKNFILETEHGPKGGDEINLIRLNQENIPNYGWPVASYGEHYGGKSKSNKKKYEKYPLLKSHRDNGFVEPIKYFVPSIGISEIIGYKDNDSYVVSSLKEKSIYFFNLNKNNEIEKFEKVKIGERIRDLIFYQNKIIMFLEDTASIGIIETINN